MDKPVLFSFGHLLSTPGCLRAFEKNSQSPVDFLKRHLEGDWGDVDADDKAANNLALIEGTRIFSAYHLNDGTKVWCITEADRSATTFLLPEEY